MDPKKFLSKRAVKDAVKVPVGKYLNVHRSGEMPDVFIFTLGRSGSNWLMELIHSQSDFKYSNQPLWNRECTIYGHLLPPSSGGKYFALDEAEKERVVEFFELLLEDGIQIRPPWQVFSSDYSFFSSRYVAKVVCGTSLISWLPERLDIIPIYLIRHPIPRGLSMVKKGWGHSIEPYLEHSGFREKYLNKKQLHEAKEILQKGSDLEKQVLDWSLQNLIPIKEGNDSGLVLSYEEMVLNPDKVVDLLVQKLDLQEPDKLSGHINRPARSSSKKLRGRLNKNQEIDNQKLWIIGRWKEEIDTGQEKQLMEILRLFDMNVYSFDRLVPTEGWLNFKDTASYKEG